MHVIFFGLKRAFHGTLRITRGALATLGLTPARFDLLYIVAKEGSSLLQRDLQRALGVAAPTVSRMLRSLEDLGLIEREVMEEDHRCRNVLLTKAGRRCVFKAARLLIHTGHIQLMVDSALSPDRWYDPVACRRVHDEFARSTSYAMRIAMWPRCTIRVHTSAASNDSLASGAVRSSRVTERRGSRGASSAALLGYRRAHDDADREYDQGDDGSRPSIGRASARSPTARTFSEEIDVDVRDCREVGVHEDDAVNVERGAVFEELPSR